MLGLGKGVSQSRGRAAQGLGCSDLRCPRSGLCILADVPRGSFWALGIFAFLFRPLLPMPFSCAADAFFAAVMLRAQPQGAMLSKK